MLGGMKSGIGLLSVGSVSGTLFGIPAPLVGAIAAIATLTVLLIVRTVWNSRRLEQEIRQRESEDETTEE